MWISREKLWITQSNCGESAHLFEDRLISAYFGTPISGFILFSPPISGNKFFYRFLSWIYAKVFHKTCWYVLRNFPQMHTHDCDIVHIWGQLNAFDVFSTLSTSPTNTTKSIIFLYMYPNSFTLCLTSKPKYVKQLTKKTRVSFFSNVIKYMPCWIWLSCTQQWTSRDHMYHMIS